ncbi:PLDc N-terminal domain-containing protein [Microcella daejeonensis]|uniref:PLDc N-terminal domain-containing protein n=1 Tax=Microcella daejeonensis TaxID=2994971 RepID=UPI002270E863|nr:PLDc N-terminal domain-containing protein [Microcella daejeonensis]WAB84173.1 PLDc N-terminal domain-containing protein [Microcella daejeonensis]
MSEILSDLGAILLLFFWGFVTIAYLVTLFTVIVDLLRDGELAGWGKAVWLVFMWFVPFVTLLVYLIARGEGMAMRSRASARQADAAMTQYVREVAQAGPASEIAAAQKLLSDGVLTPAEFETLKAKALS